MAVNLGYKPEKRPTHSLSNFFILAVLILSFLLRVLPGALPGTQDDSTLEDDIPGPHTVRARKTSIQQLEMDWQ